MDDAMKCEINIYKRECGTGAANVMAAYTVKALSRLLRHFNCVVGELDRGRLDF